MPDLMASRTTFSAWNLFPMQTGSKLRFDLLGNDKPRHRYRRTLNHQGRNGTPSISMENVRSRRRVWRCFAVIDCSSPRAKDGKNPIAFIWRTSRMAPVNDWRLRILDSPQPVESKLRPRCRIASSPGRQAIQGTSVAFGQTVDGE